MVFRIFAKRLYFRWKNRGKHVRFEQRVNIGKSSKFEGYNRIGAGSEINAEVGCCSYVGENCVIYGKIGKFCSIASEVKTLRGTHPTGFLSTSPVFYSKSTIQCGISLTDTERFNDIKMTSNNYIVEIGNDVWIGARVTILPGVTISDGAIIGASTVVTKDIPPYAVVVGNPGRIIRYRFPESRIKELLESKWWERPLSELSEQVDSFCKQQF